MNFRVDLLNRAIEDIQSGVDYYNSLKIGLGDDLYDEIDEYLTSISKNPFYNVRYKNIACMPLKRFPYMIHFTVEEKHKVVKVHAVINTARNPDKHYV